MAKKKTRYVCQQCGYDTVQWLGKCPGCGAWNTMVEEVVAETPKGLGAGGVRLGLGDAEAPKPIGDVVTEDLPRFSTGSPELDRVLGGGVIPGSMVLIVGDPGVGKSSLTLAACAAVARQKKRVLYVTGEESTRQVRMRADRLDAIADTLYVVSETNLDTIKTHIENVKPELLVIDSIQTMLRPEIASAPGSVSQVRECAAELLRIAKTEGIAAFVIGHVTKEGNLAGPRVLEHIVDTVLYFEGERNAEYRVLRAVKNRFGSTNELGLFEMRESGLVDVPDASKLFLSDRSDESGTVIVPTVEGTRPLLVEVQALVAPTPFVPPRRTARCAREARAPADRRLRCLREGRGRHPYRRACRRPRALCRDGVELREPAAAREDHRLRRSRPRRRGARRLAGRAARARGEAPRLHERCPAAEELRADRAGDAGHRALWCGDARRGAAPRDAERVKQETIGLS